MRGILFAVGLLWAADVSYRQSIERWRQEHEAELRAEDGWLTLTALVWLKEGRNELRAGVFELRAGKVTFRVKELRPDVPGPPDVVSVGTERLHIIRRGERYGVRVRDTASPRRRELPPLRWFPIQEAYRVRGRFVAYPRPKTITIPNILGDSEARPSPGYVVFTVGGRELRLEPVEQAEPKLFFVFKDLTAGKETYPAGRFLYTELPRNGTVELDFNKAENPPCAFTPYATCPLPPPQNRLAVRIEAGEQH